MAPLGRVVVPEVAYHVTHRGNRRCRVFLDDEDREGYLAFLERYSREHGMEIWTRCAMSYHVHLLVWPHGRESLGLALGRAHGNRNSGRGGLLWTPRPFPGHITQTGWAEWVGAGLGDSAIERLRRDTMTGRPCGGADFMERLEHELNRILRPQKVGRKRKTPEDAPQIPDLFGGVEL